MQAHGREIRLQVYVDQCKEHGDAFTPTELEHIVEDSQYLFTPLVVDLIKLLVKQAKRGQ